MRTFGYIVSGLLLFVVIIGAGIGLEAAGLKWYAPWKRDQQTEIIRNSNSNVTSKVEAIQSALGRYNETGATQGQKLSAVDDMCRYAAQIDDQYVPEAAKPLMRERGCWSGN